MWCFVFFISSTLSQLPLKGWYVPAAGRDSWRKSRCEVKTMAQKERTELFLGDARSLRELPGGGWESESFCWVRGTVDAV